MKTLLIVLLVAFGAGCVAAEDSMAVEAGSLSLCPHCGEVEADAACCAADAEVCSGCELHKGSPGCCKMSKGDLGVKICGHCSKITGSTDCCGS